MTAAFRILIINLYDSLAHPNRNYFSAHPWSRDFPGYPEGFRKELKPPAHPCHLAGTQKQPQANGFKAERATTILQLHSRVWRRAVEFSTKRASCERGNEPAAWTVVSGLQTTCRRLGADAPARCPERTILQNHDNCGLRSA